MGAFYLLIIVIVLVLPLAVLIGAVHLLRRRRSDGLVRRVLIISGAVSALIFAGFFASDQLDWHRYSYSECADLYYSRQIPPEQPCHGLPKTPDLSHPAGIALFVPLMLFGLLGPSGCAFLFPEALRLLNQGLRLLPEHSVFRYYQAFAFAGLALALLTALGLLIGNVARNASLPAATVILAVPYTFWFRRLHGSPARSLWIRLPVSYLIFWLLLAGFLVFIVGGFIGVINFAQAG